MRNASRAGAALLAVVAMWLAITGQVTWPQVGAGLAAGVLTTSLLRFDQRMSGVRPRMPGGWWRAMSGLPSSIFTDLFTVGREVLRRALGQPARSGLVRVPLGGSDRFAAMLAIMGASATPNTVVVGYSSDDGLLIHQLHLSEDPAADVHDRLP